MSSTQDTGPWPRPWGSRDGIRESTVARIHTKMSL